MNSKNSKNFGLSRRSILIGAGGIAGVVGLAGNAKNTLAISQQTSSSPRNSIIGDDITALDTFITNQIERQKAPGTAVVVFNSEGPIWARGYGLSDIANNIPMQPDHHQIIASISKTFAMTCAMQLSETGALDLDSDLSDILNFRVRNPNHPDVKITIRHILTHTSSLLDGPLPGPYDTSYRVGNIPDDYILFAQQFYDPAAGLFDPKNGFFASWAPGSRYEYVNVPWSLLARVVEIVSGQKYTAYVKEHIFAPLDMNNAAWSSDELDRSRQSRQYIHVHDGKPRLDAGEALLHLLDVDRIDTLPTWPDGYYPYVRQYAFPSFADGGIWCTPLDLAKYAASYLNASRGGKSVLLKADTVKTTLTPQLSEDVLGDETDGLDVGYAWHEFAPLSKNGKKVWGHGGGELGSETRLKFIPEQDLGFISFTNVEDYTDDIVADFVLNYFASKP